MSHQLINRSPDLKRLRDEGYEVEVRSNHLLVHAVPYVKSNREVALGTLVSELTLASPELTAPPGTHTIYFIGDHPCNPDGTEITQIQNSKGSWALGNGVVATCLFSNKPRSGSYPDYYSKLTSYIRVISNQARAIDPSVDARTFKVVESAPSDSVFQYEDTASSRAGIQMISARLKGYRIAIVGLGGTGSYVLDLLAKMPVSEVHLFDGDALLQHNAFRSPGAISRATLDQRLSKVEHFAVVYSSIHRNIVPHRVMITEENVRELRIFDFVFVCVDKGESRKLIDETLRDSNVPFIDVGMGLQITETQQLWGTVRVTTSLPLHRDYSTDRMSTGERRDDVYGSNIQTVDLNALNATLAVIKWKKFSGFYYDDSGELHSTYNTARNKIFGQGSME